MVSVKVAAVAGFTALFATVAQSGALAADMPRLLPPVELPPIVEDFGGWYLRGDIGMSNQRVKELFNDDYNLNASVSTVQKGFDAAPLFGLGIGYQFNNWFRADVTGEYRARANFKGLDVIRSRSGEVFTDEYTGSKSEWLFLANAYIDLGTWYNLTPFIGAGVGVSYNTIHDFKDTCVIVNVCDGGSVATAQDVSKWNFAWALHAGVAYKVTNNFTVELAYRYVSLGDAITGDLTTYLGENTHYNPMEFRKITSHDFKLGVRWLLDAPVQYERKSIELPPLMRKG
jgi:opacity protein-like surface antigen